MDHRLVPMKISIINKQLCLLVIICEVSLYCVMLQCPSRICVINPISAQCFQNLYNKPYICTMVSPLIGMLSYKKHVLVLGSSV